MSCRHDPWALLTFCLALSSTSVAGQTETAICQIEPGVTLEFLASPDANRLAWKVKDRGMEYVVLDGIPGRAYNSISNMKFSDNSMHLAFIAHSDWPTTPTAGMSVVLDGNPGERFEWVSKPMMDKDGRTLAYFARPEEALLTLVVNGSSIWSRDTVAAPSLALSHQGGQYAFVVRQRDDYYVRTNTGLKGPYNYVNPASLQFSPDGEHLSYVIVTLEPIFILDDEPVGICYNYHGPVYDSVGYGLAYALYDKNTWELVVERPDTTLIQETEESPSNLTLSPDGRRFAWLKNAPLGGATVILDSTALAEHNGAAWLTFSPDGSSLVYAAHERNGWRVIAGAEPSALFQEVRDLVVSEEGNHWSCWARNGDDWYVLTDVERSRSYDEAASRIVFDSEHELHCIARRRDTYYRVSITLD